MASCISFESEFERFLQENFPPEKQKAILDVLSGAILLFTNIDKVSKEELSLVIDKAKLLAERKRSKNVQSNAS